MKAVVSDFIKSVTVIISISARRAMLCGRVIKTIIQGAQTGLVSGQMERRNFRNAKSCRKFSALRAIFISENSVAFLIFTFAWSGENPALRRIAKSAT
jgi:hypothetical protein